MGNHPTGGTNHPTQTNHPVASASVVNHPSGGAGSHPGSGGSNIVFHQLVSSVSVLQAVQSDLGITLNVSAVAAWADQSGNLKDYSQGTGAAQPTFSAAALNGFPTLTFNGSSHFLTSALALPAPGTTPTFAWAVLRQVSWTANRIILGDAGNNLLMQQATGTPQVRQFNAVGVNLNGGGALGSWVRSEVFFNSAVTDYLKLGASSITGASAGNNAGGGTRQIGASAGAQFGNIEIAALFYCAGKPSGAELAALDAAVTTKYGGLVGV